MISPRAPSGARRDRASGSAIQISIPGAACPTGSGPSAAASAAPIRTAVTATVVSVGPYMFQTSTPGKRARSARARPGDSASPQKRKRRSAGSMGRAKRASARQKRANEGVDTHVVRGAPDRGDAPSRELARERRRRVLRQHRIFGADGSEHARDPPRRQRRVDRNVRPAEPERGEKAQQDGRLLLPVDEDR